ncbi:hypothetical protein ZIOFF_073858 [Zingiber officinale]|uniref:Gag-pol polyprotein n=1 Tax=Zingiber officinale TaxID=94328 RepID=A0A8J5C803_ZINOF|nr:hypothetical protein ZIOFF_073858 [Zingiber officinale]
MSMGNPIMSLLANNTLTGENFPKWKSNINIVLVSENNRFVLTEECPPVPPANVTRAVRELYDRWIASNNKAKAYMLASMSDALRSKMEPKECAFEIMESLQEMFGQQSEQARHEATRKYTNARMILGTHVRDHVMQMTNYFSEAEMHGAVIDEGTQVSIILNSLSSDFIPFTSNYIMNKLNYGMTQLLNELQTFEAILGLVKNKAEANIVNKPNSSKGNKGEDGRHFGLYTLGVIREALFISLRGTSCFVFSVATEQRDEESFPLLSSPPTPLTTLLLLLFSGVGHPWPARLPPLFSPSPLTCRHDRGGQRCTPLLPDRFVFSLLQGMPTGRGRVPPPLIESMPPGSSTLPCCLPPSTPPLPLSFTRLTGDASDRRLLSLTHVDGQRGEQQPSPSPCDRCRRHHGPKKRLLLGPSPQLPERFAGDDHLWALSSFLHADGTTPSSLSPLSLTRAAALALPSSRAPLCRLP